MSTVGQDVLQSVRSALIKRQNEAELERTVLKRRHVEENVSAERSDEELEPERESKDLGATT